MKRFALLALVLLTACGDEAPQWVNFKDAQLMDQDCARRAGQGAEWVASSGKVCVEWRGSGRSSRCIADGRIVKAICNDGLKLERTVRDQ